MINTKIFNHYQDHLDAAFLIHGQNVARADVPGARAQYLESFAQHLKVQTAVGLQNTHAAHLKGQGTMGGVRVRIDNDPASMTLSGNNINEEQEMAQLSRISVRRRAVMGLKKNVYKTFQMLVK